MTDVYCRDCKEFGPTEVYIEMDGEVGDICGHCGSDRVTDMDNYFTEFEMRLEGER